MREIIFRGKRVDNNEWYYGYLLQPDIISNVVSGQLQYADLFVDENTVGQYTGLKDKNGTKIFDGDIMQLCNGTYPCRVYWDGKGWAWLMNGKRREIDLTREKMQIIGNIHDNPELLKGYEKC